jgi:EAL domain-containing protein (putative c-di-GMP-specific phosphodiesterase class I)
MLQRLQENKSFEDDLLQALDNDEFRVYYQPIADTVSGEIYGYEALVRWFHPIRGLVPPSTFIPIAEKTGMINALGEWVLSTACEEAARWSSPLKVSVNVSPIQLINCSLTEVIVNVLQKRVSIRIVWIWKLPSRTYSMRTPAPGNPQPVARAGSRFRLMILVPATRHCRG